MIWEIAIICVTLYLLFGDYIKQKARELEIRNDQLEDDYEKRM